MDRCASCAPPPLGSLCYACPFWIGMLATTFWIGMLATPLWIGMLATPLWIGMLATPPLDRYVSYFFLRLHRCGNPTSRSDYTPQRRSRRSNQPTDTFCFPNHWIAMSATLLLNRFGSQYELRFFWIAVLPAPLWIGKLTALPLDRHANYAAFGRFASCAPSASVC